MSRRVGLRWPLSIQMGQRDARVLSTVTENLSSQGFCCVVNEPVAAGERVACILQFPMRLDPQISQALRCQAQVVWVRSMHDGRFSIGCRIRDYTVVT
ncbi:MAG: PilZ domain-containing protein [Bryobacteraceae bacterium]